MDMRSAFIRFGEQLQAENERAHDLWSWLPSHRAAAKAHGAYACEHLPPLADLLIEAAMFIAHKCAPTPEQMAEAGDFYKCPCGECHDHA